ncbi:MAG: PEP-CTERM sorting domain-containing protein [Myxococcota bacterium]|nr:PEP-CTERM sorting domain-containing protein [Myxococcota bacterium]
MKLLSRLALLLGIAALPLGASATVFTVTDGGLDGQAICELGFQCAGATPDFLYDPPAPPPNAFDAASGTITLNPDTTVDISLTITTATFLDVLGPVNGVDEVVFTNVTYTATGLSSNATANGFDIPSQTGGSVSGTYEQKLGGATVVAPTAFNSNARVFGSCVVVAGNATCGIEFGPGQTSLDINGGTKRFLHVFNVVAVPEPTPLLLVALGVAGLALGGRRQS